MLLAMSLTVRTVAAPVNIGRSLAPRREYAFATHQRSFVEPGSRKQYSRYISVSFDVHNHGSDAVSRPLAEVFDSQLSETNRVIQAAAPIALYEDRWSAERRRHGSLHHVFPSIA